MATERRRGVMTWEDDSAKWFLEKLETDLDGGSKAALKARLDNPDMVLVAVPKGYERLVVYYDHTTSVKHWTETEGGE